MFQVLAAYGVSVTQEADNSVMSKGDIIEVQCLPDSVHRRMLHRLARLFGVPIHHFYRPGLAPRRQ